MDLESLNIDIAPIEAMMFSLEPERHFESPDVCGGRLARKLEMGSLRLEGKSYMEIAQMVGVSRSRVSQILWKLTDIFMPDGCSVNPKSRQFRQNRRRRRMKRYLARWPKEV